MSKPEVPNQCSSIVTLFAKTILIRHTFTNRECLLSMFTLLLKDKLTERKEMYILKDSTPQYPFSLSFCDNLTLTQNPLFNRRRPMPTKQFRLSGSTHGWENEISTYDSRPLINCSSYPFGVKNAPTVSPCTR